MTLRKNHSIVINPPKISLKAIDNFLKLYYYEYVVNTL